MSSRIYFIDILTKTPFGLDGDKRHLGVQFEMKSDDCDISFTTNIMTATKVIFFWMMHKFPKIPNDELMFYISIMCLSAFAGIISSEKLVTGFPNNMNQLEKVTKKKINGIINFTSFLFGVFVWQMHGTFSYSFSMLLFSS